MNKKQIISECDHLANLAENSNTGGDLLVVGSAVSDYKKELEGRGYTVSSKSFGEVAIINVKKA